MVALKNITGIFLLITLFGCARTVTLENGRSVAPVNQRVFKNKALFGKDLLADIDTTVIYEEFLCEPYYGMEKGEPVLARYNYRNVDSYYTVYRFYGNGCYSEFSLNRNDTLLTSQMFNPAYTGWRGVLYKKKEKILGDTFAKTSGMPGIYGKRTELFMFQGDTMTVKRNGVYTYTFVKRRIPQNLLNHRADW